MTIKNKLNLIVPPNDYKHRYEFSNQHIIDKLDSQEKKEIENLLIIKLYDDPQEILIIETLSYMKSENAIPVMRISLEKRENMLQKIIIAVSIYKINHEKNKIDIAIDAFEHLHKKWDLVFVFSYLKEFNDQ